MNKLIMVVVTSFAISVSNSSLADNRRVEQRDLRKMIYDLYGCSEKECDASSRPVVTNFLSAATRILVQNAKTTIDGCEERVIDPLVAGEAGLLSIKVVDIFHPSNAALAHVQLTEQFADAPPFYEMISIMFLRDKGNWLIDDSLLVSPISRTEPRFAYSFKYKLSLCQ